MSLYDQDLPLPNQVDTDVSFSDVNIFSEEVVVAPFELAPRIPRDIAETVDPSSLCEGCLIYALPADVEYTVSIILDKLFSGNNLESNEISSLRQVIVDQNSYELIQACYAIDHLRPYLNYRDEDSELDRAEKVKNSLDIIDSLLDVRSSLAQTWRLYKDSFSLYFDGRKATLRDYVLIDYAVNNSTQTPKTTQQHIVVAQNLGNLIGELSSLNNAELNNISPELIINFYKQNGLRYEGVDTKALIRSLLDLQTKHQKICQMPTSVLMEVRRIIVEKFG